MTGDALRVSSDQRSLSLTIAGDAQAIDMTSDNVDDLIRSLGAVRASMLPPFTATEEAPHLMAAQPAAVEFRLTRDDIDRHLRLYILHPGFGWIYLRLPDAAIRTLVEQAAAL